MLATEIDSSQRNAARCDLCPLNRVKTGIAVRVKRLLASPEVAQRLREIGFCEESVIELLTSHTNVICLVCNARLALSTALAESILVEPLPVPALR
jgi:Fe2+ transport system protein FeoA